MHILHVITSLRVGGAERLLTELLPRLQERGHRVELLLFDGTHTPFRAMLEQQGIPIHTLGCGAWQMHNPLHLFRLRKFLDKHRFDVVHTHNTPCQLLTALAAGKEAPILVTTEHNTFNRRRNWPWYRQIDRWMYGRYRQVVCVSDETRRRLVPLPGCESGGPEVTVVPNGIDLTRFVGAEADPSLRQPDERARKILLMVSAFRPQKDQPTLIRAMRQLSDDYRLWLVGDGPLRAACEKLAGELHLSEKVRFWGVRSDIPELLATADVVVLASHYEGMPLSGIEGMASGKPFVASDVEGLHELVSGAGELVPPADPAALAGRIRQLCEDRDSAARVAARCRERAMQYAIGQTVAGYERIYTDLAHRAM